MSAADHTLAEIGISAISEASPCGENARYEPEFEKLEAELSKQESLTSATVDWGTIVDTSAAITRSQSKDILVGSYLCYGLLLKEGFPGLAVGLKILSDMCETHWDCLFPPAKRMRARATAFVWLAEKAGQQVSANGPAPADGPAVIEAMEYFRKLDGALVEKMGDQAPMLTDLSKPLKAYAQSAQAEAAKAAEPPPPPPPPQETVAAPAAESPAATPTETPPPVAAAPAPEPPAAAPPPVAAPTAAAKSAASAPAKPMQSVDMQSEADSKKQLRQIQAACRDTAAFWLSQKQSDARAYRLARQAAWMTVDNAPPANEGVTQIMPLPAERLKFFEGKLDKKEFSELLPELEKTLARSAFWLDGHCMVAQILKSLGPEYAAAQQTLINELRSFLQRLPDVVDLSFSDQTPFASDQTRMWLESEILSSTQPSSSAAGTSQNAAGDSWSIALADASKIAISGDAAEAFALMNQGLQQAGSQRSRLYWRCALAELSMQVGKIEVAGEILEQVAAQLDVAHIAQWEPELLSYAYRLLHQSYQKQLKKSKDDNELKLKAQQAYEKLCWFDPITALSEKGG